MRGVAASRSPTAPSRRPRPDLPSEAIISVTRSPEQQSDRKKQDERGYTVFEALNRSRAHVLARIVHGRCPPPPVSGPGRSH